MTRNYPIIAVVGASGLVGKELLFLLQARKFPVGKFLPFASGRHDACVEFKGSSYKCPRPSFDVLKSADLVFFVSHEEVSRRFGKRLAAKGVWCIDDSSEFRMDSGVPLVIPEVNACEISQGRRLIAGPNCTLTGIAVAGYPIHKRFGIKEIRLATYQSVSGAGKKALVQFEKEVRSFMKGHFLAECVTNEGTLSLRGNRLMRGHPSARNVPMFSSVLPRRIAFNLFPQVGNFDSEGGSGEEIKISRELRKIWNFSKLKVSSTAVRVPVVRGHALAAWITTRKKCTLEAAGRCLKKAHGIKFYGNRGAPGYPTPLDCVRAYPVMVGRLRRAQTSPNELQMWIVSDNLYKGAALNSIQIAEFLLKKRWL